MPLFTIATITLNNAQGIDKTWNSIKTQEPFNDYEWLVQDGGSTDETLTNLQNTTANTISEADKGIYNAMNRLIGRATGEYIIFLNAGDALAHNDTLKSLKKLIKESQPDFIYGDAFEEDGDSKQFKPARHHEKIALGMFTHHQSMIYKRTIINDLRYNETYKIAADYDFTARILRTTQKVEYIENPICIFEPGGISQQQTNLGRHEQFQIRKNLKLCSPIQNYLITSLQYISIGLRTIAPNLYWGLKQNSVKP